MARVGAAALLAVAVLLVPAGTSWALSGDKWLEASEDARKHYLLGVIDTWMGLHVSWEGEKERRSTVSFNKTDREYQDVTSCILERKMSYSDVIEVVEMHVRMSIDKRDASMSYLALEALTHSCNRAPLFSSE